MVVAGERLSAHLAVALASPKQRDQLAPTLLVGRLTAAWKRSGSLVALRLSPGSNDNCIAFQDSGIARGLPHDFQRAQP